MDFKNPIIRIEKAQHLVTGLTSAVPGPHPLHVGGEDRKKRCSADRGTRQREGDDVWLLSAHSNGVWR